MSNEATAVSALEDLGLTEYEARCYVALARVPQGTAKEVSQLSDVPRSRVYDTLERLHERGLVDVQESDPREYKAIPKEHALDLLRQSYQQSLDTADTALDQLETIEGSEERGVWAVANAGHVNQRIVALLDDAHDHVHHVVADESVLTDAVLDRLSAASERGVTTVVEVPSEDVGERVAQAAPAAEVGVWDDLARTQEVAGKWPGQLVMADHRSILASGVEESDLPTMTEETAVWTRGRDHGFATWTRELLDDRLEG